MHFPEVQDYQGCRVYNMSLEVDDDGGRTPQVQII